LQRRPLDFLPAPGAEPDRSGPRGGCGSDWSDTRAWTIARRFVARSYRSVVIVLPARGHALIEAQPLDRVGPVFIRHRNRGEAEMEVAPVQALDFHAPLLDLDPPADHRA